MRKLIILFLTISVTLVSWSQVDKSKTILDQLSKKTRSFKTISAGFVFSMKNNEIKINEKNEGTIKLKGQKYSIDLPGTGLKIYSDGKTIWNYLKSGNQVTISNLADSESEMMNPSSLFSIYEKGYKSKFVSEKNVGGKPVYNIDLTPEKGKDNVKSVKLTIDKNDMFLKSALLKGKDGNEYSIEIKNYTPDLNIPDTEFIFDPKKYKDIEIIDVR